jgi:hypothetical protein
MPMHDWTKVPDGIFHAFHHGWIWAISEDLNAGRLPTDYYALPEQIAAGWGPDVLTLQDRQAGGTSDAGPVATASPPLARPSTRFTAETEGEFYRRRKKSIAVRHVSGDRVVAVLEIISPGNKSSAHAFRSFVQKALELLEHRVHLTLVDPFPPGKTDPEGIHAAIWEEMTGESFQLPDDKPLTTVADECDFTTRAYIEPVAVGAPLPEVALFVEPNACVMVPLEATYQAAYSVMPRRWRKVLEAEGGDTGSSASQ